MDCKNLMIGDWVDEEFVGKHLWILYDFKEYDDDWEKWISPIPLTAEILEKNGFEQDALYGDWIMGKKSPSIMDRGFYLEIQELEDTNSWGCEISRNNGIHIRYSCSNCIVLVYVHELQHALRLCGLNELADNFKV